MTRQTLERLLERLERTSYPHWMAVEVQTKSLLRTIDNEADALRTIDLLDDQADLFRSQANAGLAPLRERIEELCRRRSRLDSDADVFIGELRKELER